MKTEKKRKYRTWEVFSTTVKPFDTLLNLATTSSSVAFLVTRIELIVIPMSYGVACGLRASYRVVKRLVLQNYKETEAFHERL